MKRYESYKDSGVKWLGEIPGHWEVRRLKFVTKYIFLGKTPKYSLIENKYKIIGQKCNQLDGIKMCDCKYAEENFYHERKEYEFLLHGDVLLNSLGGGSVGRIGYYNLKEHGVLTDGHIIVIRNKPEFNSRFLYYFLSTKRKDFETMASGSTNQMFLLVSDINKQFVPLPPKSEQTAIANYLDSVTSKIDEAISQQQKMIDLLNERKQIIIQNAVTKGLDPNAKMKDSGVEWIGEIPEDWKIIQLRHTVYNKDYLRQPITADQRKRNNPQYAYYGASGIIDKIDNYNVDDKVLLIGEDGANLLLRNLPLIYKAEGKFWVNNHAHILKPRNGFNYDYLAYVMEAADYTLFITGSAQPKLSQSNLNAVKLPIPSFEKQSNICDWLSPRIEQIDSSISQCNKMISLLQERKQIIINDVVTGKVKVI